MKLLPFTLTCRLGMASMAAMSLTACTTSSTPATVSTQILADAQGLVAAMKAEIPLIAIADPGLMTAAQQATALADLAQAQAILTGIAASTPATTAAVTLQSVETDINFGLNLISAVASGTGQDTQIVQAIIVLSQGVEAYVNATIGTNSMAMMLRAHAMAPDMTAAEARQLLHVRGFM